MIEREVQDGQGRWYTLRMRPYRTSANKIDGVLIVLIDIDMMKRNLEEIHAARLRNLEIEAQLALAGEGLGVGTWEYDTASNKVRGTKRWCELNGLPFKASLSRDEWIERVHPNDREPLDEDLKEAFQGQKVKHREYRVILPDGSIQWLDRRVELIAADGESPSRIRGISISIEERKLAEERLTLASKIASAQEEERQRIARESHDGLVQDLAAVAIDIGRSATKLKGDGLGADLRSFESRIVKSAEAARHVAYRLHPSELDDLGLVAALRAYCEEFGATERVAFGS